MTKVLTHNQTFSTPQDALAHYGKLGMKWGVRNDRAGYSDQPSAASELGPVVAIFAVIAGIRIAQARYQYVDSGGKNRRALNKEAKKSGKEFAWKKKDSLKGEKTHDEISKDVVPGINKGFPTESGTSMNCRRCTFAYEMRRRGMDVKATRTFSATGQDDIGLISAARPKSGTKLESTWGRNKIPTDGIKQERKSEVIFETLGRQPNGSRGELAFSWPFGGGHSVAYEVVNNKPVVFDTQSGKSWSSATNFHHEMGALVNQAAYTRLDNAKLNDDFLKKWVTHAD